jgi:Xaa-Pro aminopeptidase
MRLAGVYHPIPEGTMIGHSIGVNVHEEPMILKNNHKLIKENMIIVIEPVICKDFFQIQDHILVQKNNSILISKKFKTNQLYII